VHQNIATEQYKEAGALAHEALTSIRTVSVLNAQVGIIGRYRVFLLEAMKVSIYIQMLD
jgi:hypothetical protein